MWWCGVWGVVAEHASNQGAGVARSIETTHDAMDDAHDEVMHWIDVATDQPIHRSIFQPMCQPKPRQMTHGLADGASERGRGGGRPAPKSHAMYVVI